MNSIIGTIIGEILAIAFTICIFVYFIGIKTICPACRATYLYHIGEGCPKCGFVNDAEDEPDDDDPPDAKDDK